MDEEVTDEEDPCKDADVEGIDLLPELPEVVASARNIVAPRTINADAIAP